MAQKPKPDSSRRKAIKGGKRKWALRKQERAREGK